MFNRSVELKYGDTNFVAFLSSTLSRLAYFNDNKFLTNYSSIMGPVIPVNILKQIDTVIGTQDLKNLKDDMTCFDLYDIQTHQLKEGPFKGYVLQNSTNYNIDYVGLNMPQNINIINKELQGETNIVKLTELKAPLLPPGENEVKYISIAWSNYGEIYIVADKRMSNTIFVIFRGTYSAKTAALYSKPHSLVPLTVCKDEKFLYGIFKPTVEMIHTIIESITYLATNFLNATKEKPVTIFTTGHSLGGAMCSNFSYLWMGIKKTPPYNNAPYDVLSDKIICISLGSPRCMSPKVAANFCKFCEKGKIFYLRITTRGDPITGLPAKSVVGFTEGFQHPCSDNSNMRQDISEDCNDLLQFRPNLTMNNDKKINLYKVNYDGKLNCKNTKLRINIPNPLSHTMYLYIKYLGAVDIGNFLKGIGVQREITRTTLGSTVCRVIIGSSDGIRAIFFNVNEARGGDANELDKMIEEDLSKEKPDDTAMKDIMMEGTDMKDMTSVQSAGDGSFFSNIKNKLNKNLKIGGEVAEDIKMTNSVFKILMDNLLIFPPLTGDLAPLKGKTILNLFKDVTQDMPKLDCPSNKFDPAELSGGKRRTKKNIKSKNKYKMKKNKTRRH